ncbi:hypothetical protein HMPREF9098_0013 [Kingella denitrificans ATCC 33394]|uniref:Uncharacterized protein n=1 Tax=Kingella denitrificans ATCC 33394 TaxID=888741 RepID=F0EVX9_9NEIS|nr:hypothetical protein HMPREF9098_0013 [Kingella denitrificans ATCC 33394]
MVWEILRHKGVYCSSEYLAWRVSGQIFLRRRTAKSSLHPRQTESRVQAAFDYSANPFTASTNTSERWA